MGNCQTLPDNDSKKASQKTKSSSHVIVSTFTWSRDSHGLFDYESKVLIKKVLRVQNSGSLKRNGDDIGFSKDSDKSQRNTENELLKLYSNKDGNFVIDTCKNSGIPGQNKNPVSPNTPKEPESLEQDPWLVIKSYKNNTNKGYKLSEGEIIKLGRVKFRIREIKGSPTIVPKEDAPGKQIVNTEVDNNISMEDSFKKSPKAQKNSQTSFNQTCRICLDESCEADDPFCSPCNCVGSLKHIHIKCLRTWLKRKVHTKTLGAMTFTYWKNLECELCKTPLPQIIEAENKKFDAIEIERPDCAYIALDLLHKDKNLTRGVHLIRMEGKNNIRLGRGHDSDIRITDISVSRYHALIRFEKGNYYIEDNNSKFGTLLHLSNPLPITGDFNNITVQIGRSVVTLTSKKGRSFFNFFFNSQKTLTSMSQKKDKEEQGKSMIDDVNPNDFDDLNQGPINIAPSVSSMNNAQRNRDRNNNNNNNNASSLQNSPRLRDLITVLQINEMHEQAEINNQNNENENEDDDESQEESESREIVIEDNEGNVGGDADERSFGN